MKMRHKIRHRNRKCVILSAIFPLSKPKQSFTVPREAHQLGFKGFFIHHSRPPSFSQYHNSHPGGHNNRGAPDHNHRFANGSQSDRRGFLSNSETSESDLAVFTTDDVTKRPEHQNFGATRRFYHKKPPRIDVRRKTRHQRNRVLRH